MPEVRFGPYTLVKRIAVGGMAEVFLARAEAGSWDDYVVVKQILPQLAEEPDLLELFFDEARIASRIYHPGIVRIIDFGNHDGIHFLAMEHVDGLDLSQLMRVGQKEKREGRTDGSEGTSDGIPLGCVIRVAIDLCRALHFAHEAKDSDGTPLEIVHRDVSPHNVLISRRGDVKLGDFGIARARIRARKTATGILRGKIAYVSPEQYLGQRGDRRVDVYAVGVVLFETIASRRPFIGEEAAIIREIMTGSAPTLSSVAPEVSPALSSIVAQALARSPDDRFQTADVLADALEDLGVAAERSELARFMIASVERRERAKEAPGPDTRVHATTTLPGADDLAGATQRFAVVSDLDETSSEIEARVVPVTSPSWPERVAPVVETLSPQTTDEEKASPPEGGPLASDATARALRDPPLRPEATEARALGGALDDMAASVETPVAGMTAGGPQSSRLPPRTPPRIVTLVFGLGALLTAGVGLLGGWLIAHRYPGASPGAAAQPAARVGDVPPSGGASRDRELPGGLLEGESPRDRTLSPYAVLPERVIVGEAFEPTKTNGAHRGARPAKKPKKKPRRGSEAFRSDGVAPASPQGELSLDSDPWSFVRVGKRDLGVTPLANIRLPAGRHRLRLENPETGISRTIVLDIKPEEELAVRVRLQDGRIQRR